MNKKNFPGLCKRLSIVTFMVLSGGINVSGQSLNSQTGREYKIAHDNASEVSNYADKAKQTENLEEAKSYMQTVLVASRKVKNASHNAEELLIEQEKQISNSTDKELIENVKDQKEEIARALEEANLANNFAEKASQATDLETLHTYAWKISKASKKVMRQIEAAQHYSSSIKDTKTNY